VGRREGEREAGERAASSEARRGPVGAGSCKTNTSRNPCKMLLLAGVGCGECSGSSAGLYAGKGQTQVAVTKRWVQRPRLTYGLELRLF
jgi:hypothetical protein